MLAGLVVVGLVVVGWLAGLLAAIVLGVIGLLGGLVKRVRRVRRNRHHIVFVLRLLWSVAILATVLLFIDLLLELENSGYF